MVATIITKMELEADRQAMLPLMRRIKKRQRISQLFP